MTLTEISYYGRKMLPFLIIFCFIILILFYIFKLLFLYLQAQPQQTVLRINPIYGKIRKPVLKETSVSANFEFVLDTIDGEPITASETAKIYPLPPTQTRLKFYQQIYLMAKTVGFDTENVKHKLIGTEASFDDGRQKLSIDITNFNFSYEYQLKELSEEGFFINSSLPGEREIEDRAINFLNSVGRYPEELAQGKRNLVYVTYRADSNEIILAPQNQTSNMVEVDFYRADIDEAAIVTPKYFNSQNYVILVFSKDSFKVIKAQVQFFERSLNEYGIYPIKTGEAAWEELKANKAIIISVPTDKKIVNIKNMFIGYFDPDIYQAYLQPVYVFLGEDKFVGYVPAIDNQYLTD